MWKRGAEERRLMVLVVSGCTLVWLLIGASVAAPGLHPDLYSIWYIYRFLVQDLYDSFFIQSLMWFSSIPGINNM